MEMTENLFKTKNISSERAGKIAWRMFCTPQKSNKPPSSREQKLAQRAEKIYLKTENREIVCYRWHPISSVNQNKRILLIHAWNHNALSFVALTKSLIEQGFEVISFDGPGHGESSGQRANIIEFSIYARAVIEEIGDFYAIIGHSIGGMTISYMIGSDFSFPQTSLERLVMISTPNSLENLVKSFMKLLEIPEDVYHGINSEVKRLSNRPIEYYSTSNFASLIEIPLLLIHDIHDEEVPLSDAEKIASMSSNSKIVTTEKLGHNLTIRSPKVIKEILAFI
ncbi:MAG: alpha/beta hydrolase [Prochloraceae cyanobacterium]